MKPNPPLPVPCSFMLTPGPLNLLNHLCGAQEGGWVFCTFFQLCLHDSFSVRFSLTSLFKYCSSHLHPAPCVSHGSSALPFFIALAVIWHALFSSLRIAFERPERDERDFIGTVLSEPSLVQAGVCVCVWLNGRCACPHACPSASIVS